MKNRESEKRESVEIKQEWETPRIFELDFAETRLGKKEGGVDGPDYTPGNLKS